MADEAPPPPLNVAERLKALGIIVPISEDDTIVEPKMITGNGPVGSRFRFGRFADGPRLNRQDCRRLIFFVHYVRDLTWMDLPEGRDGG